MMERTKKPDFKSTVPEAKGVLDIETLRRLHHIFNHPSRDFYVADSREVNQLKYTVEQHVADKIEGAFTYHPPKDDQPERYVIIRDQAKQLAYTACQNSPASREQSLALTALENFVFWCNAAIARNE